MAAPPSPTPLESIPSSAAPGKTNEMTLYSLPHTATGNAPQGFGPHRPIPNASQTMSYTNPSTHHLAFASHAYTGSNYQADLLKFKEDLANIIKSKLSVDLGSSCLYQKLYPPEFDFVSYPAGWRDPEFFKFLGDDSRTTWEHVSQYILQLGEVGFNDALCVRLFYLSLIGTAFSWFSSLAPNSI